MGAPCAPPPGPAPCAPPAFPPPMPQGQPCAPPLGEPLGQPCPPQAPMGQPCPPPVPPMPPQGQPCGGALQQPCKKQGQVWEAKRRSTRFSLTSHKRPYTAITSHIWITKKVCKCYKDVNSVSSMYCKVETNKVKTKRLFVGFLCTPSVLAIFPACARRSLWKEKQQDSTEREGTEGNGM